MCINLIFILAVAIVLVRPVISHVQPSFELSAPLREDLKLTYAPSSKTTPAVTPAPTTQSYRVLCDIDRFFKWKHSQELSEAFTYVQVGAHKGPDADSNDPVQKHVFNDTNARGILIEPVPGNFKILQEKWKNQSHIHTVQAAVSNVSGEIPFYYVTQKFVGAPTYWDQLGSFNLHHIQKHKIPDKYIDELHVSTMTGKQIVNEYDVAQIDMLIVDAEGYDDVIVQSFLDAATPGFLIFEIHHIGRDRHRALHSILRSRGYDCQICAAFDVNAHCQLRGGAIHGVEIEDIAFEKIEYTKD